MKQFRRLQDIRQEFVALPSPAMDRTAVVSAIRSQATRPIGSLGRLDSLVEWLMCWKMEIPKPLQHVEILIFAGNHGVASAHDVSLYRPEITARIVQNCASGRAPINALAKLADANLRVLPISLERPTQDISVAPAMDESEFLEAFSIGYNAVDAETDLLCLGEIGIGNTTVAAALCSALFGDAGARWAGRGTGVPNTALLRKRELIDVAIERHANKLGDPLEIAATFGGRELAAIFGATLAARIHRIPVILDGFVCTAAVAPMHFCNSEALLHTRVGQLSAEAGHRDVIDALGMKWPILNLGMKLGEGAGSALAVPIIRAALECHLNCTA